MTQRNNKISAIVTFTVLSLTGCSLLVDTDLYIGPGASDGGLDGSMDASQDPDAPSAPDVHIEPGAPTSVDDLTAVISRESMDPLRAGGVTYEYRWTRDGEDASESGSIVDASAIASGEVWGVSVTPVAADGERRGVAGTAEVTIGNIPPTLAYLGLDSYRPIEGEVLQAIAGPVDDPDGDAVRIDYRWFSDNVEIDGVTGPRLTVTGTMVGTRIRVEAAPNDMTDAGATLEAGPAVVLSDETRWRQLLPNRTTREGDAVVFDPVNRRVLLFDLPGGSERMQVWEYALGNEGGQFIQLFPEGEAPPIYFTSVVYDEGNERLLFFAGFDIDAGAATSDLYSFDVSQRGSERWEQLSPAGESPPPRAAASMIYDHERRRAILYGGISTVSASYLDDLWSLDLSAGPGFESWTRHDASTPGGLVAAGFVVDSVNDRALLIGGGVAAGGDRVPFDTIYTLDLTDLGSGFVSAGSTLPAPLFGANVGSDERNGRAIVALGVGEGRIPSPAFYAIDYATLAVTTLDLTGDVPREGGNGWIVDDRYDDRLIMFRGAPEADEARPFDIVAVTGSTVEGIHRYGVDSPPALNGGPSGIGHGWVIAGGETLGAEFVDSVWRFDFVRRNWDPVAVTADSVTGGVPTPRGRTRGFGNSGRVPSFWGGYDGAGGVDTSAWTLELSGDSEGEWTERTLRAGEVPIPVRDWPAVFPVCSTSLGAFGGRGSSGLSAETSILSCDGPGGLRECAWSDPTTGAGPTARYGASAATLTASSEVILFGGVAATGAQNDVWTMESCASGAATWSAQTVSGTPPNPRWGHTLSVEGQLSGATSVLLLGGIDDGAVEFADSFRLIREAANTFRWETITVPSGAVDAVLSARYGHHAAYDENTLAPRLLVYGGKHAGSVMSDFWELRLR